MHSHTIARVLLLASFLTLLVGCSAQDQQQLQQAADQANATLAQAQTEKATIQKQLTTLPANDPARAQIETQLAQLDQVIAQIQTVIPLLQSAIKSAPPGQVDPSVQQAVSAIPYGTLALAVMSIVFGIVKHVQAGNLSEQEQQAQKAFEQIVAALDAALPAPTPEQQAKVEAVLDTDVKAKVAAVRAA